jgi:serine/threonine protein kinase
MALTPGTWLSQYEILSPLGAGSMGEVYRARDTRLDRDVAIKVLPELVSSSPERLQRFEVEAKAAAALNHPNILAVYQMGTYAGVPYLVSELLEGKTLAESVRRGPLPLRKAIDYGVQIAHGLAAAHEKGIVHRDLKPDNLFVTKDGRVKILDFGLAKVVAPKDAAANAAPTLTLPGVAIGTVGYMSPEQVRGLETDHRTDIFAFGAILYEMVMGRGTFDRPTSADTMSAILNEDPAPISERRRRRWGFREWCGAAWRKIRSNGFSRRRIWRLRWRRYRTRGFRRRRARMRSGGMGRTLVDEDQARQEYVGRNTTISCVREPRSWLWRW